MQLPTGTDLFQPDHYYSGWVGGRVGIGELDNKANSVQLQLQLPTGTELGNISYILLWANSESIVPNLIFG